MILEQALREWDDPYAVHELQEAEEIIHALRVEISEKEKVRNGMNELLGDELKLLDMLPDYNDIVWQDLKSPAPWSDLDGVRCDIDFAKKELRKQIARLLEIEQITKKVTEDWSMRCQKLEDDLDRILTLATKWCDKNHHDWEEIKRMADSA